MQGRKDLLNDLVTLRLGLQNGPHPGLVCRPAPALMHEGTRASARMPRIQFTRESDGSGLVLR